MFTIQKKKKIRTALCLLLFITILLTSFFRYEIKGRAEGTSAVVTGASSLNVRTGPGTDYDILTTGNGTRVSITNGYNVGVISEAYDSNRELWYEISFTYDGGNKFTGYVMGKYIRIKKEAITDANFESYLNQQGFPESYKNDLRILHTEHPSWIFEAQHTGLDWNTALSQQSVVGKNLIQNSSISSWKSMESGAYNYDTGSWVVFDGSTWVSASRELIAYYMDSRNFLDGSNIFQFEKLSYNPSYQTAEGIKNILKNSFMNSSYVDTDGWAATYTEAFIYGAEQSQVSPYHLASRALQELGTNRSNSVSGTVAGYEGHFNFYNIGATSGINPVLNGLTFAMLNNEAYLLPWNTEWKSIAGGAIYLGTRYINAGQDTLYLQKFNVQGSNPYTHQYMTNVQAPSAESKKMALAYQDATDTAIVFKIPVFSNMPETASHLPTATGGSNSLLSSLGVEGYSLTPTFNKNTTEYDLVLTEATSSVRVNATSSDSNSNVSGTGVYNLMEGYNTVHVIVTAQNNRSQTYTINIVAPSGPSTFNGGSYSVATKGYLFNSVIAGDSASPTLYGVDVGTKAADFISKISATNCKVKIVNGDRTENTGVVATGNYLQILAANDTGVIREIPIVIYGDINGDGAIDAKDLLYMKRHLLEISTLTGANAEAADINWDDKVESPDGAKASSISAKDLLYLKRHLLDIAPISQK